MSGSKLVFAIFLITILSLGGVFGFYFYLNRSTAFNQPPVIKTKPTFSGFDQIALDNQNDTSKNKTGLNLYNGEATTSATSTATIINIPEKDEQLRLISAQPIAGNDFIIRNVDISTSSTQIGTSTAEIKLAQKNKKIVPVEFIRYIVKMTGNVLETGTSSTSTTDRITNKTLPKIQEGFFNKTGDGIIIRNTIGDDAIQTRYLSLKADPSQGTSTIQKVITTELPLNITQLSLSPDKTKDFYTGNLGQRGVISNLDGGGKVNLFNSPFKEWLIQWVTQNTILLNTKPSGLAPGYLYSLDVKTGNIKKILGGLLGLTSLGSNDGQNILYTSTKNNVLELNLYNNKEASTWVLPAETLPEKCVWGNKYTKIVYCAIPKTTPKDHVYPDDWYLGLMHFDDVIWRMDLQTGENKVIIDPIKQIPFTLDVMNMKLSKNDDYLIFEDKNTLSLWGIKLKNPFAVTVSTSTATTIK